MVSKEKSSESYIATAFDQHRGQMPSLPSLDQFRNYLLDHLKEKSSSDLDKSMIRIVRSSESGNGKSLVAARLSEKCQNGRRRKTVQLHDTSIDFSGIVSSWLPERGRSNIFHLDVSSAAVLARSDLVFSLAVLGGLNGSNGTVWVRSRAEYYLIEMTSLYNIDHRSKTFNFEDVLPTIVCLPPFKTAQELEKNIGLTNEFLRSNQPGLWTYLFDHRKYFDEVFQRPYLYLNLLKDKSRDNVLNYCSYDGQAKKTDYLLDCLHTLLDHCSIENPTWLELTNFASFLNVQLGASEKSIFCNTDHVGEALPGMKTFVVTFLLRMAKDFATRSAEISDESHGDGFAKPEIKDRQKWENLSHPYIFFNEDRQTLSFFGFLVNKNLDVIDDQTGRILIPQVMSSELYKGLRMNGVDFTKSFDQKSEVEKLADLCRVLGVRSLAANPDKSYELTADNAKKILAIHMRFRSNIPVIIMGMINNLIS